jgi:TatD DNase family protein
MVNRQYVDMHCHLDLYSNPQNIIQEIEHMGIHVIAMTNAPFVFHAMQPLVSRSNHIHLAIGLHPELIRSYSNLMSGFIKGLGETRFVGEVGLDYSTKDNGEKRKQRKVFEEILVECGRFGDKVISVHSRRAAADVIDMVGKNYRGVVVLHWFSGTLKQVELACSNGFYFSVNPAMVLSDSARRLIAAMPPSHVLTETDGPFVEIEGKVMLPCDVSIVVRYLVSQWKKSEEEVTELIYNNYKMITG